MSEVVDAVASETPGGPAAPGAGAADAGMRPFGRTLLAPFVFGLAVGYIWLLILDAVSINFLTHVNMLSSVPPVLLLALVMGVLFVWPGAAAVVSTVGDARFWGAGSMTRRASAAVRLALALLVALVVGNLARISSFAAELGSPVRLQRFYILYPVVQRDALAGVESAFLIGVLAAFTFGRWPVRTRRLAPLAQLGRWLVVGALAAAGLLLLSTLDLWVYLIAIGALVPPAGNVCGGAPCHSVALTQLAQLGQEFGGVLVGAILGGALRAGPVGMWRRDTGAAEWGGTRTAAPQRRSGGAYAWGALGLGFACGAAWIGGIVATPFTLLLSGAVAAVLLALLGALVPLGVLVVSEIRRGRRAGAARGHGARFVLALVGVLAGLAPAYLLVRIMHLSDALLLIEMLWVITPGFSAGVALGYAFGAGAGDEAALAEGWWRRGTRAAFWGGIGFGLSFLALQLTQFVLQTTPPTRCTGRLDACMLGTLIHVPLTQYLVMAAFTPVAWAVLGGVAGAALRVGVVGRKRAG